MRKDLIGVLKHVLGRHPEQHEFDLFFTCAHPTDAHPLLASTITQATAVLWTAVTPSYL
jgi:hypothetical protein